MAQTRKASLAILLAISLQFTSAQSNKPTTRVDEESVAATSTHMTATVTDISDVDRTPAEVPSVVVPDKPGHGRAKAIAKHILVATLVIVGLGAVIYYGRGLASGCNVPSDRASDGSRCGGRAASERPGGR